MLAELDFEHRAHLDEWMDQPCSYQDFRQCLRDLARVNTVTLARRPTLRWLRQVPRGGAPLHIVDVGCGGGDTLRHIEQQARRWGVPVRLTGIDLNPYAARAAREFTPALSAIEWVTGDAFSYVPEVPVDVVISSLFTHHLPVAEIVRFLRWMSATARIGWFINDLHRQRKPYFAFTALAWAARWHRFVQHDGPVSIRRSFREADWRAYLQEAGLGDAGVRVTAVWPARLCVSWLR